MTALLVAMLSIGSGTVQAQSSGSVFDRPANAGPSRAGTGMIEGSVSDTTLRPLNSAEVSIVGVGTRVTTSENGRFRILQVPAGQYLLVVRRIGYAPTSGMIEVSANDTLRLAYMLARSVSVLDTSRIRETRVTTRMLAFEQRRAAGVGQFITQEAIERRGSAAASDFLRNVRGVEVSRVSNDQFSGSIAMSRREGGTFQGDGATGACVMQVLLDGIVLPRNFNLELLPPPKNIAGIEIYSGPATIPPQFGGPDRRCGMIAVWTRDGY